MSSQLITNFASVFPVASEMNILQQGTKITGSITIAYGSYSTFE